MQNFSFLDKIKILMNIIVSSSFYIGIIVVLSIVLLVFILSIILKRRFSKWIYIGIWFMFLISIIVIYREFMLNLIDNLFDTMFMALYFPNLATYIIIILVTNFFFVYTLLKKDLKKFHKILNIVNMIIINLLFVLTINVVSSNNINVYETLTVYSNSNLLVLLELSSAFFTAWLLLNLLVTTYYKLKKYDEEAFDTTNVVRQEIIFDWV